MMKRLMNKEQEVKVSDPEFRLINHSSSGQAQQKLNSILKAGKKTTITKFQVAKIKGLTPATKQDSNMPLQEELFVFIKQHERNFF